MDVSKEFCDVLRRFILACGLILLGFAVGDAVYPHQSVSAQNAGVVGIQSQLIPVFSAQSTTKSSGTLADIGQGINILRFCNTSFTGTIDLEWSPTNNGTYSALQTGTFPNADSGCHNLTVSGYWPQLRATVTPTGGSLSAWYSSSSGPGGYVPAIGSNGPTFPVSCDQNVYMNLASGAGPGSPGIGGVPFNNSATTVICGMFVSFASAPSSASPGIEVGWSTSIACGTVSYIWAMPTSASTPLAFPVPLSLRSYTPATQFPCFQNVSGVNAYFSISYAVVQL